MKQIIQTAGILVFALVFGCKSDPSSAGHKPAAETQPVNTAVAPNATESASSPADAPSKPRHLSIDTNSNISRSNYEKPTASTPTPSPIIAPEKLQEKPIGPPGFVTRDGTVLYAEPNAGSAQLATMKKTENVYILETSMKGENGEFQSLPTWYKVQRKTKKKETGWVKGNSLDSGGGG